MTKRPPKPALRLVPIFSLACITCMLPACTLFDPAGQSRKVTLQDYVFGWDASSNFTASGTGSQTGSFKMAEGEIVLKEDGTPDPSKSKLTAYMDYTPSAQDAVNAYQLALAESHHQAELLSKSFDNLLGLVLPMIVGRTGSGVSVSASAADSSELETEILTRLDAILTKIEESVVPRDPAPP